MKNNDLQKYIGDENLTVVEIMKKIDFNSAGILYIVDGKGSLEGSISDGDVRRWIIKTGDLSGVAKEIMNRKVRFVMEGDTIDYLLFLNNYVINSVPVVKDDHSIVDIIFRKNSDPISINQSNALNDTPVIVMAGGKGTRLYPYTKIIPKPLIPINGIPILERILDRFHNYGVNEFYLTVNYKKGMIKAYFNEEQPKYKIHYIEEDKPLGTAGSIRLINDKFDKPIIVTNCDILIETDYQKILQYHVKSKNDMTIVASLKNTMIPYGVLHIGEKGIVQSMEEKPVMSNLINTGMYIINPKYFDWIPKNTFFHMTDLAEKMIKAAKQVGVYPISEDSFLDMGQFEEIKKMEERITKK
jgi:dTDP-glucose pyrophosphorylase